VLMLGRVVVADSVNPSQMTRSHWRAVAARVGVPRDSREGFSTVSMNRVFAARTAVEHSHPTLGQQPGSTPGDVDRLAHVDDRDAVEMRGMPLGVREGGRCRR
jgi:hypothetical protein